MFSFIHDFFPCALHLLRIYYVPDMVLAAKDATLTVINKLPDIIKQSTGRYQQMNLVISI